jgi:hypothetical protein
MTLSPGTLYCMRMAVADEEAAVSILDQLWTYDGPIALEYWQVAFPLDAPVAARRISRYGRRHSEPRSA